jgi:hypothetical protein
MAEFIDNRFWAVLPYRLVRDLPQLQLSPAAVKEERARKPRLLCDHSWYPVNEETLPHAPPESMQFGGTLPRVLRQIRHANPKYGPVHMCKHDVKDGYYRLYLNANDCPRLSIILPKYAGEEQLIAIPMACTMGWVQSPPTFCTASETITDVANARFRSQPRSVPDHRLEAAAARLDQHQAHWEPAPLSLEETAAQLALSAQSHGWVSAANPDTSSAPPSNQPRQRPVGTTDVFVDDFIQLGQGSLHRLKMLRQHLLHRIDAVLARPRAGEARHEMLVATNTKT